MFAFVAQVMAAPDKRARLDRARRVQGLVERLPDGHDPTRRWPRTTPPRSSRSTSTTTLPDADALVYRDAHAAANLRWWRDRSGDKVVYWAATPHTANAPALRIGGPPGPDLRFPSVGSYLPRLVRRALPLGRRHAGARLREPRRRADRGAGRSGA